MSDLEVAKIERTFQSAKPQRTVRGRKSAQHDNFAASNLLANVV